MAERMKTSPSGIHISLLKSEELLTISFSIMSLAISHRFILTIWRQTHQTLLQKDSKPFLHRMRYINILEVDVQILMKRWWDRELQYEVDSKKLINQK